MRIFDADIRVVSGKTNNPIPGLQVGIWPDKDTPSSPPFRIEITDQSGLVHFEFPEDEYDQLHKGIPLNFFILEGEPPPSEQTIIDVFDIQWEPTYVPSLARNIPINYPAPGDEPQQVVFDEPIAVRLPAEPTPIIFGGTLTLECTDGNAIAGAIFELVDAEGTGQGPMLSLVTDAAGNVALSFSEKDVANYFGRFVSRFFFRAWEGHRLIYDSREDAQSTPAWLADGIWNLKTTPSFDPISVTAAAQFAVVSVWDAELNVPNRQITVELFESGQVPRIAAPIKVVAADQDGTAVFRYSDLTPASPSKAFFFRVTPEGRNPIDSRPFDSVDELSLPNNTKTGYWVPTAPGPYEERFQFILREDRHFIVEGRLSNDGATTAGLSGVRVKLLGSSANADPVAFAITRAGGSFSLVVPEPLFREYRVNTTWGSRTISALVFEKPDGTALQVRVQGSTDAWTDSLSVTLDKPISNIAVEVSADSLDGLVEQTWSIRGKLVDDSLNAMPFYEVVCYEVVGESEVFRTQSMTNSHGYFPLLWTEPYSSTASFEKTLRFKFNSHDGRTEVNSENQPVDQLVDMSSDDVLLQVMSSSVLLGDFQNSHVNLAMKTAYEAVPDAPIDGDYISPALQYRNAVVQERLFQQNAWELKSAWQTGWASEFEQPMSLNVTCRCNDCANAFSKIAYLADLIDYASKRMTLNENSVDIVSLSAALGQPIKDFNVDCETAEEEICQTRIAVEVLRAKLKEKYDNSLDEQISRNNIRDSKSVRRYRQLAYFTLLRELGVSYDELRAFPSTSSQRPGANEYIESIANRLGIDVQHVESLILDAQAPIANPMGISEKKLEQLFGLPATESDLNLNDGIPDPFRTINTSALLGWQRAQLKTQWEAQDRPSDADALHPAVVDPDIVERGEVRAASSAMSLLDERMLWLEGRIFVLKSAVDNESNPTFKLDAALQNTLVELNLRVDVASGESPWSEKIQPIVDRRESGQEFTILLASHYLSLAELDYLTFLHEKVSTSNLPGDSEWENLISILVGAEKRTQYAAWRAEEAANNLLLGPEDFVLLSPQQYEVTFESMPESYLLRFDFERRQQWAAILEKRTNRWDGLAQMLESAIRATEKETLSILRDALIVFYASEQEGTQSEQARWAGEQLILEMQAEQRITTRIDQAIESLQLLLYETRIGTIDSSVIQATIDPYDFDEIWTWLGTYQDWHSAVHVLSYPEEYLNAVPRGNETALFEPLGKHSKERRTLNARQSDELAKNVSLKFQARGNLELKASCSIRPNYQGGAPTHDLYLFAQESVVHEQGSQEVGNIWVSCMNTYTGHQEEWQQLEIPQKEAAHLIGATQYKHEICVFYRRRNNLYCIKKNPFSDNDWSSAAIDLGVTGGIAYPEVFLAQQTSPFSQPVIVAVERWKDNPDVIANQFDGSELLWDEWKMLFFEDSSFYFEPFHWPRILKLALTNAADAYHYYHYNEAIEDPRFEDTHSALSWDTEGMAEGHGGVWDDSPSRVDLDVDPRMWVRHIARTSNGVALVVYDSVQKLTIICSASFEGAASIEYEHIFVEFGEPIGFIRTNNKENEFTCLIERYDGQYESISVDISTHESLRKSVTDKQPQEFILELAARQQLSHIASHCGEAKNKGQTVLASGELDGFSVSFVCNFSEENGKIIHSATRLVIPETFGLDTEVKRFLKNDKLQRIRLMNEVMNTHQMLGTSLTRTYLRELYFFVPLWMAQYLRASEEYKAALDWLRTVYDYASEEGNRRIYAGLKQDYAEQLAWEREDWLRDPLDPHSIAHILPQVYVRHTFLEAARTLIEWADGEFVKSTAESVALARELYEEALEVLSEPELKTSGVSACQLETLPDQIFPLLLTEHPRNSSAIVRIRMTLEDISNATEREAAKNVVLQSISNPTHVNATQQLLTGIQIAEAERDARVPAAETLATNLSNEEMLLSNVRTLVQSSPRYRHTLDYGQNAIRSRFEQGIAKVAQVALSTIQSTPETVNAQFLANSAALTLWDGGELNFAFNFPELAATIKERELELHGAYIDFLKPTSPPPRFGFCAPPNPALEQVRAHAQFNLEKIHHDLTISGFKRSQPLYVREAGSGRAGGVRALTYATSGFRFEVLLRMAKELAQIASQIEGEYLAALKSYDEETYRLLGAEHNLEQAKAALAVHELRVNSAQQGVSISRLRRDQAEFSRRYYADLIQSGLLDDEQKTLDYLEEAEDYQFMAEMAHYGAAASYATATALSVFSKDTVTSSGANIAKGVAATLSSTAAGLSTRASSYSTISSKYQTKASNARREQQWRFQKNQSLKERELAEAQIGASRIQWQIAFAEQNIARLSQQQAVETFQFLLNKFMSADLYQWMIGVLRQSYKSILREATSVAKLAWEQLVFERQESISNPFDRDYLVPANAAPELRDAGGLTGSARLRSDIVELEAFERELNKRRLQLSKTFSIARNAPEQLYNLQQSGRLVFATELEMFDRDFPGHFRRRIEQVRVSLIALTPPVEGIRASLMSHGTSYSIINELSAQSVAIVREPQRVSLSSPANANGIFELEPQSELLRPFEGLGVATEFLFELPKAANAFDFSSIFDVYISIDYSAQHSETKRNLTVQRLPRQISETRAFSVRNEFPDEWYTLHNEPIENALIEFKITPNDFRPGLEAMTVNHARLLFLMDDLTTQSMNVGFVFVATDSSAPSDDPLSPLLAVVPPGGAIASTRRSAEWMNSAVIVEKPFGTWAFTFPRADHPLLSVINNKKLNDVILEIDYRANLAAWH